MSRAAGSGLESRKAISPPAGAGEAAEGATPVRPRAFFIGALLIPLNYYGLFYCEVVRHAWISIAAPFFSVIFWLALLAAGNALCKRIFPGGALRGGELLTLYVMLSVATAFAAYGFTHYLVSIIAHPLWTAAANRWEIRYGAHLPTWLVVQDADALKAYSRGGSTFFRAAHLHAWLPPLAAWIMFIDALAVTLVSTSVLFSHQWSRAERLTYPVVELPFHMVSERGGSFYRSRLLWLGVALSGGIELCNGINFLYPAWPAIPVKRIDLSPMFPDRPWSALSGVSGLFASFYPFAIGLSFLMPLDLLFSTLGFFLLVKLQYVLGAITGMLDQPGFPYHKHQQFGACVALCLLVLWGPRRHLRAVVGEAAPRRRRELPADRRIYPMALGGLALGSAFCLLFAMAAGMAAWIAVLFFAFYGVISLGIARIRAEVGFPIHYLFDVGPPHMLVSLIGTDNLGAGSVPVLGLFSFFNQQNTNHPLPHMLEGLKLADRSGTPGGSVLKAILVAVLLSVPISLAMEIDTLYRLGAGTAKLASGAGEPGNRVLVNLIPHWLNTPAFRFGGGIFLGATAWGLLLTLFLGMMRARFFWWPLHPLGYVIASGESGVADIWTCMLISGLVKGVLLRYGGLPAYRRAMPFFLGLILGDCVVGSLWLLVGLVLGIPTYVFWL
jgi:hypothetical protein